jgi:hypothetical protein
MALKGTYNFKGIELSDAYIRVKSVSYHTSDNNTQEIKTAAVYNPNGTIKTEAVYDNNWETAAHATWQASVYKDKAQRDSEPGVSIQTVSGGFTMKLLADSKNPTIQAYEAIKAEDLYKDYADI